MVKKILAVDDEKDVVYTIKHGLEKIDSNYKVTTVTSGKECLQTLDKGKMPDVILIDLMMPDMNGWDLIQELKCNKKWNKIPIIFLTARTDHVAKNAGNFLAEDYIEKPFEMSELKKRIDNILNVKVKMIEKI
jgi:CheY-like chemotaxis protein